MNEFVIVPADAYYGFRLALGIGGSVLWAIAIARAYGSLHLEPDYERRVWTFALVTFPEIYSIGYTLITAYSWLKGAPVPDAFPLVVATGVQMIAFVYGFRLVRRPRAR